MTDPYNIERQLAAYQRRKLEVAEIQEALPAECTPVLIQYRDDIKYIRFLLETIRKLQK